MNTLLLAYTISLPLYHPLSTQTIVKLRQDLTLHVSSVLLDSLPIKKYNLLL